MSSSSTPCPRCGQVATWANQTIGGRNYTTLLCTRCGWSSATEPACYSPAVTAATWLIYVGVGAVWWLVLGFVHIFTGIESPFAAFDRGCIVLGRYIGIEALLGVVVGHILHYTMARGQREQNIMLIVTVPIVLFSVVGVFQGLMVGSSLCIPMVAEIPMRAWWVRGLVGLFLGRLSVRPAILLIRTIRIVFGLRERA